MANLSPFAVLTPERASIIVDRVFLKVTTATPTITQPVVPQSDFLEFFSDASGAPGSSIYIVVGEPDTVAVPEDGPQSLLLWAMPEGSEFEIGGGRIFEGVGWRFLYPPSPRHRQPGEADVASLVSKLRRILWNNPGLSDADGNDPQAERIVRFEAARFVLVDAQGARCGEIVEGRVVYEKLVEKEDV